MGALPVKTARLLRQMLTHAFLSLSAVLVLIPFYWMAGTSLKPSAEVERVPPTLFPGHFRWANYIDAIRQAPLLTYLLNTIIVGIAVAAVGTIITVLSAYAFARMHFPGRQTLFFTVLAMMMIPQEMLIITNFRTIAEFGWMNTWQALIVPFWVNPFNIFLLRQTFMQIPDELYWAAKVEGMGHFRYLTRVMLPLSRSTVAVTVIFTMIWIWQTYAWPNLVTTKDELRLVSNGLQNAFTNSVGTIEYELQMAAAMLVTLPLILLFLLLRKPILSGMIHGGIKG